MEWLFGEESLDRLGEAVFRLVKAITGGPISMLLFFAAIGIVYFLVSESRAHRRRLREEKGARQNDLD